MECEGEESCERAEPSRPRQTNSKADLAGSRTGQELAQCHQIGICAIAQPLSPRHQLVPEIAQMCDRSTEGGEPQLQECAEYLGDARSEEHTSELQSLIRNSYAVFRLKKQKHKH